MSDTQRVELAHAKINLVLRILAREASGYHSIETLFQLLELHDVVTVRVGSATRTLSCDGPAMPASGLGDVEQNLAWRAAEAFASATHWNTGWDITIDKHIPVGGGLGGGSADAAAVLRAMNALSPSPISSEQLLELAGVLGADVPFLVTQASRAWGWGRGDRLQLLPALPAAHVTLLTFAEGVNTGAAYGAFAAQRASQNEVVRAHAYAQDDFASWQRIAQLAENDFERVVPALHAGVRQSLQLLSQHVDAQSAGDVPTIGMMSGSGATCFLLRATDPTTTTSVSPELAWVNASTARVVETRTR